MSRSAAYLVLAASLVAVAASQLLLKARLTLHAKQEESSQLTNWAMQILTDSWAWLAVFLVLLGVACWYLALVQLPLTVMMPMATLIAPVVTIGAHLFLAEALGAQKMAAILIMTLGAIWLVAQEG